ncbi:MAG TPA: Crp/Fnr family transcriptional regulator [Calditrichia bacterium]|nr:Crp/Fnr family transcriptional regulator [Calditrichota bacterium]HQU71958.1 Crp/Fnr family transcriptional regulator [Calditrichia bacterium]HQV31085.1 Crp/Fnr family transcriptional regulator [Calditrichia bacterium]
MNAELKRFFEQYGDLSETEMASLAGSFKPKKATKGELLLMHGQICDRLYFVDSGCLRLYYIADGVEITVWFSFENNSAIELSSFLSGEPSAYFLEAIEDSDLFWLSKSALEDLYQQLPGLQRIMRIFWEDVILNLLRRFTALQKDSAAKRYLDLMKQPFYLQRIPQKYLASYIGITPTSLSRIRREIK